MAGEYWRCKRCEVCFVMSESPVGCANDMCSSTDFEPVVVLPVAEYERLRGIEKRMMALEAMVMAGEYDKAFALASRAVLGEEKP